MPFVPRMAWDTESDYGFAGLTKREHFAGLAMQGYCGGEYTAQRGMPVENIAKWAVQMADELLAELDKEDK